MHSEKRSGINTDPTCENYIFERVTFPDKQTPPFLQVLTHYANQDSYSEPTNFQVEGSEIGDLQEVRGYPVNSTAVVIVWNRPNVPVDVRTFLFSLIFNLNMTHIFFYSPSTLLILLCIFFPNDTFLVVFPWFVNDLRVELKTD